MKQRKTNCDVSYKEELLRSMIKKNKRKKIKLCIGIFLLLSVLIGALLVPCLEGYVMETLLAIAVVAVMIIGGWLVADATW